MYHLIYFKQQHNTTSPRLRISNLKHHIMQKEGTKINMGILKK